MGGGDVGNLRIALRSALSEAAQSTAKNRMTQLSGLVEGGSTPSVFNAAIGLAQSGLKTRQETILSDVLRAHDEQRKALEFNPDNFRSAQGGIYDLKNNKWIVDPTPEAGKSSSKISRTDATVLNLPLSLVGTSWNMLQTQLDSDTPPEWFLDIAAQDKKNQSPNPEELKQVQDAISKRLDAGDKEGARALAHTYNQKQSGISKEELKTLWDQFREQFLGTFSGVSGGVDFDDL